jgi:hypothetical protein
MAPTAARVRREKSWEGRRQDAPCCRRAAADWRRPRAEGGGALGAETREAVAGAVASPQSLPSGMAAVGGAYRAEGGRALGAEAQEAVAGAVASPRSSTLPPTPLASDGFVPSAMHRSNGRAAGTGHGGTDPVMEALDPAVLFTRLASVGFVVRS